MAELGQTVYMGETTQYISRADGYFPDGTSGYSYNFLFALLEKERGGMISLERPLTLPSPPPGITTYYVMRGKDVDCGPITYRTWTVTGGPDTTGSQYSGPKCGGSPLEDIVVVFTYVV